VKIEGGLGVGGVLAGAGGVGLNVEESAPDDWVANIKNTSSTTPYGLQVSCQTNTVTAFAVYSESAVFKVQDSFSFFTGNVAIGGTTAANALDITGAADTDIQVKSGDGNKAGLLLGETVNGSGFVNRGVHLYHDGATGKNSFGIAVRDNADTDTEIFSISRVDKAQDHKANSIVNSSTVQGLQDGAAYDFDEGSVVVANASSLFRGTAFSFELVLKQDTDADYYLMDLAGTSSSRFILARNNGLMRIYNNGTWFSFSPTVTLDDNEVHHIVITVNGTAGVYYDNGVEAATVTITTPTVANTTTAVLGSRYQLASGFFPGQIQKFRVFPSALTAPDVRKLYSGENPKKNLNVELVTNGTFDSNTTGWTVGSSGETIVASAGKATLELLNGSISDYPKARTSLGTLTDGKTYLLKVGNFTRKSGNAIRVKINNNSSMSTNQPSGTLLYNSTSNIVDGNFYFTPTDTEEHFLWMYMQDYTATSEAEFDNLSVTEVGTLVDFNPRSASSGTWYNQAIPSLYNGSLEGGVTLSAGSTDYEVGAGEDRTFKLGQMRVDNRSSYGLVISHANLTGNDFALRQSSGGTTMVNSAAGADLQFRENYAVNARFAGGTGDFYLESGKKLGVGTVPGQTIDALQAQNATSYIQIKNNNVGPEP